jgi:hypothetical protein
MRNLFGFAIVQTHSARRLENYTLLTPRIVVEKFNDHGVSERSSLATFSNRRSLGLQNIDPLVRRK